LILIRRIKVRGAPVKHGHRALLGRIEGDDSRFSRRAGAEMRVELLSRSLLACGKNQPGHSQQLVNKRRKLRFCPFFRTDAMLIRLS
jgi:hypothetical protein